MVTDNEEQEPDFNPDQNKQLSSQSRFEYKVPQKAALQVSSSFNKDGTVKKIMKAKKMDWISKMIWLDGKPFDFSGREYLRQIYNTSYPIKLLKTGRQEGKCLHVASLVLVKNGQQK